MTAPAQLTLPWKDRAEQTLDTGSRPARALELMFVRNARARRYILRVLPDASVRVTIPRHGSRREADAFVRTRTAWIAARQGELEVSRRDRRWRAEHAVWWRGEACPLNVLVEGEHLVTVRCGDLQAHGTPREDYRGLLEPLMRARAAIELPARLLVLAAEHALAVSRVTIRNQRSRWGSCSRDGHIALNWRLMQMPASVREYVLLHELMHLREPNHSSRFWALVASACPQHADARAWLRAEGIALS